MADAAVNPSVARVSKKNSSGNNNRTKKNSNKRNETFPTVDEMLVKLKAILLQTYKRPMPEDEVEYLLNNFLPETATSRKVGNSNSIPLENIKERLELYKTNFLDANSRINTALSEGKYNVNKVLLHGGFPTNKDGIIFKRQIVPSNIVLCFLTSLSRESIICGFNNPIDEFPKLFPIGSNNNKKKNTPTTKLLKNLICIDKYTPNPDISPYNNQTIANTLFRDSTVYLPGQIYPDLNLLTEGPSKAPLFFEENNKRTIITNKIKTTVSTYITTLSTQNADKITYVFIYSCRDLTSSSSEGIEMYQHELLNYSLNLMLFPCKQNINSGISKAFAKSTPRFGELQTLSGDQKRGQILQIITSLREYLSKVISRIFPDDKFEHIIKTHNLDKIFEKDTTDEEKIKFSDEILKKLNLENPIRTKTFVIDQMGIFQILNYLIYDVFINVDSIKEFNSENILLSTDETKMLLVYIERIKLLPHLMETTIFPILQKLFGSNFETNLESIPPVFVKAKTELISLRAKILNQNTLTNEDIFAFMINPIIIFNKIKTMLDEYKTFIETDYSRYSRPFKVARQKSEFTRTLPSYGHKGKEYARKVILGIN